MKSNVYKLGEFLALVDNRNTDLAITNLQGVSISKEFMPSIANIVGTDLSSYKIVRTGQFAYGPVTSRNGDKISIARLTSDDCIISSSYTPFEVTRPDFLCPEYLMLWFMRPEFDRYARYMSNGSAREVFDWDCMCNVDIPVPPIEEQRKIVRQYKVVTERIELINNININIDEQISTTYHRLFDDNKSFADGTVGDLGEIVSGATPSTSIPEYYCSDGIHWLTPKDLTSSGRKFISKGDTDITKEAYESCSTKMIPTGSVLITSRAPVGTIAIAIDSVCTNQGFKSVVPSEKFGTPYVYQFFKENKRLLENNASGTTFLEISGNVMKSIKIKLPPYEKVEFFNNKVKPLFDYQRSIESEKAALEVTKSLLLRNCR